MRNIALVVVCVGWVFPFERAFGQPEAFSALVYTRTAGFRHDSIPAGVAMVRELGERHCFTVEHTEDPASFTAANLARFRVVVFLNTTGDVLDSAQEAAMEGFVRNGGGFVGIHSAADTEYEWPFYRELIGAYFLSHPAEASADLHVEDAGHPATAHLPSPWSRFDEWYNFRRNPRPDVRVLLRIDESTYSGGTMGADHPIAWCDTIDAGRTFYTAGGHTVETYSEPLFRRHVLGGVLWAAGAEAIPECTGDLDCDGGVGLADLAVLLAHFGATGAGYRDGDLDGNGEINLADLSLLLARFGVECL